MNKPLHRQLTQTEIDFLKSLSVSELESLLNTFPRQIQEEAVSLLMAPLLTEREKDVQRKRKRRSEAARIVIPDVVDWNRRESCLKDPEKFLVTYFPTRYRIKFGKHHYRMIDTLIGRAKHGGRQAVAAPRGCGKSEVFKGMLVFLVLACLVRFPLLGAATSKLGKRLYQDFKNKIATNDLLLEDFPEVCWPVRELDGAPQRANKQHIDGEPTKIVWTSNDYLRLPDVPGSPYGGVKVSYFGLDTAFRGFNIDGDRPDFVPIDDPETRESAKSYDQGVDREEIIDKDIAGLASQEENLAIAVLTTVQNCYCLSARLTDPKVRPSFNGLRYGLIESWPNRMDLWETYIAIRHKDQVAGDEFGLNAVKLYTSNMDAMNEGCEMLSEHFIPIVLEDGTQLVHSALQQAMNKIADTNREAFETEYQNNPKEDAAQNLGLTAAMVANRTNGLERNSLPNDGGVVISMGLDVGDYYGHWVKIAWFGNAIGCIIDYGVMEVPTMVKGMKGKAQTLAILRALLAFAPQALAVNPPDLCMIDTGDGEHTDAVYEAIHQLGGLPFVASKGWDDKRFRMPVINDHNQDVKRAFKDCWAGYKEDSDIWLYNVRSEEWKHEFQKGFTVDTFDQESLAMGTRQFNEGSISLFSSEDPKRHLSFSHHVVAEERQQRWVEGQGWVRKWNEKNQNNHWLDAGSLACCCAGCLGIVLIEHKTNELVVPPVATQPQASNFQNPHGQSFLARR